MSAQTKKLTSIGLKDYMPEVMIYRGYCTNLDTCTQWGIYSTTASTVCENPPSQFPVYWKYAVLEVLRRESTTLQRLTCSEGMAFRTIQAGRPPSDWTILAQVN